MPTPLTDAINALTRYANETTGQRDTTLSEAVNTLIEGYGGGTVTEAEEKDINFYDYDGTRLYSFTKTEWESVTELPPNPSHDGLTAQGWNYTKAEIDSSLDRLITGVRCPINIGQNYVTTSGATEIDIELFYPNLSPSLYLAVNGSVIVDWGDNTSQTITGNNLSGNGINTPHTYANDGKYTIKLSVTSGSIGLYGRYGNGGNLLLNSGNGALAIENIPRMYMASIKSIRIGNGVAEIKGASLGFCGAETITIPSGVSTLWGYNFYGSRFKCIVIPRGSVAGGEYGFFQARNLKIVCGNYSVGQYCFSDISTFRTLNISPSASSLGYRSLQNSNILTMVVVPPTVTTISAQAFMNDKSLTNIHLMPTTPPTLDNTNAFSGLPSNYIIYVPYSEDHSVLTAYQSATNWSSISTHIQEEPQG